MKIISHMLKQDDSMKKEGLSKLQKRTLILHGENNYHLYKVLSLTEEYNNTLLLTNLSFIHRVIFGAMQTY